MSNRKQDHLDLCNTGDVGFHHKTTLLDDVELLHDALPELALDEIDTRVTLLGKTLAAPLFIAAMTGGTERATAINRTLAAVAEQRGLGFGLGSQRPMLENPNDPSYLLRDIAPNCLLLGNLGAVQARSLGIDGVAALAKAVQADAMCIHLNPAQELIQQNGDRDFRGVTATLSALSEALPVPVIAKETGCGISAAAALKLSAAGVKHVDVSGAGGTSWVAVEAERAVDGQRALGLALREWGIPTAVSVINARAAGLTTVIATGGIRCGLDIAKAIALGANAAGIARPILQAHEAGGARAVNMLIDAILAELKAVMLLVGAGNINRLRATPLLKGPTLQRWTS